MILFEVHQDGTVTSTPSFLPQGTSLADMVVVADADYTLVTMHLVPPTGAYIPDVVFTPTKTDGRTLWQAILPPEATVPHGAFTYQLFLTFSDGRVVSTNEGKVTVPKGTISNMPETVAMLGEYSISALNTLLGNIYAQYESLVGQDDAIKSIVNALSVTLTNTRTDLASAQATLDALVKIAEVNIPHTMWSATPPYRASAILAADVSTEMFLLVPADEQTRTAAQGLEVVVEETRVGAYYIALTLSRQEAGSIPPTDLKFYVLCINTPNTPDGYTPRAEIVGVVNLPDELMDREYTRLLDVNTPASIDLSRLDDGVVVEVLPGGETLTTRIEYDGNGNPVKITDGRGRETVITW